MLYDTENKPKDVTFLQLDSYISHAMDYLGFDTDIHVLLHFTAENLIGYVDVDEDLITIHINKDLKDAELAKTIFHEMVHVDQIMKGRYVVGENGNPGTWLGVPHEGGYWNSPWELQAYRLEEEMMETFNESRTKSNL